MSLYIWQTHVFFDTNFSLKCSISFNFECRQQTTTVSVLHPCAFVVNKNHRFHITLQLLLDILKYLPRDYLEIITIRSTYESCYLKVNKSLWIALKIMWVTVV